MTWCQLCDKRKVMTHKNTCFSKLPLKGFSRSWKFRVWQASKMRSLWPAVVAGSWNRSCSSALAVSSFFGRVGYFFTMPSFMGLSHISYRMSTMLGPLHSGPFFRSVPVKGHGCVRSWPSRFAESTSPSSSSSRASLPKDFRAFSQPGPGSARFHPCTHQNLNLYIQVWSV